MNDVEQIVVFLSSDLMFYSKISAAAKAHGFSSVMVPKAAMIADRCTPSNVAWVCIDLFASPGDISEVGANVRETCEHARLIGFGPHVQKEDLESAKLAGFDLVLTRGEFNRDLNKLFEKSPL